MSPCKDTQICADMQARQNNSDSDRQAQKSNNVTDRLQLSVVTNIKLTKSRVSGKTSKKVLLFWKLHNSF